MLCNITQNAMGQGGVPISHNALQHYPECHGTAGGVPCQVQPGGGTLPGGVPCQGGGVPCPGGTQLGQHREYLLHGGRYASCVHAGGLSCFVVESDDRKTNVNCGD